MFAFITKYSYPILSLILILGFGLWFVFKVPPFQVPDEPNHFGRLYGIVNGQQYIVQQNAHGRYGYVEPQPVADFSVVYDGRMDSGNRDVRDLNAHYKSVRFSDAQNAPKKEMDFENTVAYSPINYLPQAEALKQAEAWDLSLYDAIIYIKIVALLVFVVAVIGSYGLLPKRAWPIMFVLTALPNTVQQAASLSADSFTNTVMLLFVAALVRLAVAKKTSKTNLFVFGLMSALLMLLALCKPTYILFGLLPLIFVGPKIIKSPYIRYPLLLAVVGISAALALWWNKSIAFVGLNYALIQGRTDVMPATQLHNILHTPVHYVHVLVNTFLYDTGNANRNWLGTFISKLAARGPVLPIEFQLLGFAAIGVALSRPTLKEKIEEIRLIPAYKVAIAALVGLATGLAIVTALYITFTTFNLDFIMGLQGRYMIPISFLLLFVTVGRKALGITITPRKQLIFIASVVVVNLILTAYAAETFFIT